MYFKLAVKNVKKSFKDFLIYFLTICFAVCLFYTFNSFQEQQVVLEMNQSQQVIIETLTQLMQILSIFVAIVLAFLILYANHFLIKRRKKELGLYMLMGMSKHKMSRILVYETFFIGLLSSFFGLLAGIMLSQALTAITASLFEVKLNYQFIFSKDATIMTLVSFSIIFILSMAFNTLILSRYKLIDLLHAHQKQTKCNIKHNWISLVCFVISISILTIVYTYILRNGSSAFAHISELIIAGSIATVLFFFSLTGFMVAISKTHPSLYYKNLNCFIIRQLQVNIHSNFISMSIVCIMLLLGIGALSTGLSLNNAITTTLRTSTPYDYSLGVNIPQQNPQMVKDTITKANKHIQAFSTKQKDRIARMQHFNVYYSEVSILDPAIIKHVNSKYSNALTVYNPDELRMKMISLTNFNQLRIAQGLEELTLKPNEVYLHSNNSMVTDFIQDIVEDHPTFTIKNQKVTIVNDHVPLFPFATSSMLGDPFACLVTANEDLLQDAAVANVIINIDEQKTNDATLQKACDSLHDQLMHTFSENELGFGIFSASRQGIYENIKGLSIVFTFIGIYLGSVFLIASAVILALQQLSLASDNRQRYQVLQKLGVDNKMINRSIFQQIAIYFLLPLILAIIHSVIGIYLVNTLVVSFGKASILLPSLLTGSILLIIYGSYFLITYTGSKAIIKKP